MNKKLGLILVTSSMVFLGIFLYGLVEQKVNENEANEIDGAEEFVESEEVTEEEQEGQINDGGLFIKKAKAVSLDQEAIRKSDANVELMRLSGRWMATNYKADDIKSDTWVVRSGDTLWEIAEAKYGSGQMWRRIAQENNVTVSGSVAWIYPGATLCLCTGQE